MASPTEPLQNAVDVLELLSTTRHRGYWAAVSPIQRQAGPRQRAPPREMAGSGEYQLRMAVEAILVILLVVEAGRARSAAR